MDLRGICFGYEEYSGHPRGADLSGVTFANSNLAGANLAHVNLTGAELWQTDLSEATLFGANAADAYFGKTDLRNVDLYTCRLNGAVFWQAQMEGANLHAARLWNATFSEVDFGPHLIQESESSYRSYFERWYVSKLPKKYGLQHLRYRHREAAEVYMNLKNPFMSSGRYDMASRAYIKEKQLRRSMLAPWLARRYYPDRLGSGAARRAWFYLSTTWKWLLDWAGDLSCGYGERPLRPIAWTAVIIASFAVLFYLIGGIESDIEPMRWIDYLNYSLGAFTTMGFDQFHARTPLAQTLTSLEALSGISILAILMFTLGNRISRS